MCASMGSSETYMGKKLLLRVTTSPTSIQTRMLSPREDSMWQSPESPSKPIHLTYPVPPPHWNSTEISVCLPTLQVPSLGWGSPHSLSDYLYYFHTIHKPESRQKGFLLSDNQILPQPRQECLSTIPGVHCPYKLDHFFLDRINTISFYAMLNCQ